MFCSIHTDHLKIQVAGLLQFSSWWLLNTEPCCYLKVAKFFEIVSQVCGKHMDIRLTFVCMELNCTLHCVPGSNIVQCLKGQTINQVNNSFSDHFPFSFKYPVRSCIGII